MEAEVVVEKLDKLEIASRELPEPPKLPVECLRSESSNAHSRLHPDNSRQTVVVIVAETLLRNIRGSHLALGTAESG